MTKLAIKCHGLLPGRVGFRYGDIGHGKGNLLWWLGKTGRLHRHRDRGGDYHYDVLPASVDIDRVWRGRIEVGTGRTSLQPPLAIFSHTHPEAIQVPGRLVEKLRRLGGVVFYVDTMAGLRRVDAP